jgi:hypothetical protein
MAGLNSNTKLLLHCNGDDESTLFPDASDSNHTVTAHGTAQVDTAEKKFGSGSLMLDGNSDYLSIPDSADWDIFGSNSDNWTIDFWCKHNNLLATAEFHICQFESTSNYWRTHANNSTINFTFRSGASTIFSLDGDPLSNDVWHHIAIIKKGSTWGLYIDGNREDYVTDINTTKTYSSTLRIGARNEDQYVNGYIDELRIQHSNYFDVDPETDTTITVPTLEYGGVSQMIFDPLDGSEAIVEASTADSKAISAGDSASTADSKAVSAGTAASTADSKAVSAGTVGSTADSKAVSAGTAASTADSKAVSAGTVASTAESKADSVGTVTDSAIGSEPDAGEYKVTDIKRDADGSLVVEYDDSAIGS